MLAMKLLYAEDEVAMSEAVVDVLRYNKYIVDAVYDGQEALDYAEAEEYDGIILDIMMPKMDGLEVLKRLRQNGCKTPVLLLTAKSQVEDQIAGLDLGADDYLPKPFSMNLLLARIRAMLRRKEEYTPNILTFGNTTLNQGNYELATPTDSFILPKLEYQLMELLMINKNIYLSTDNILTKIWGYDTEADHGIVGVYISYLRKRLTALKSNITIVAKRNVGYRLEEISE